MKISKNLKAGNFFLAAKVLVCSLLVHAAGLSAHTNCPKALTEFVQKKELPLREDIRFGRWGSPKLVVNAPIYRELWNVNLIRHLLSLSQQTSSRTTFQILFVVNNSPEIARGRTKPEILQENQETLQILRWLSRKKDSSPPPRFAKKYSWFKDLAAIKASGLTIRILDQSTRGTEPNIGKIRARGAETAGRGLSRMNLDPIIGLMDGDTLLPSDYAENILVHFANPLLETLFLNIDFYMDPHAPPEVFESTYRHRFELARERVVLAFEPEKGFSAGSPQIVVRYSALKRIGGVPRIPDGEDLELARRLSTQTHFKFAHDITVYTADRVRADGFDAKKRLHGLQANPRFSEPRNFTNVTIDFLADALIKLREKFSELDEDKNRAQIFDYFGFKYDALLWKDAFQDFSFEGVLADPASYRNRFTENLRGKYFYLPTDGSRGELELRPDESLLKLLKKHLRDAEYKDLISMIEDEASKNDGRVRNLEEAIRRAIDRPSEQSAFLHQIHDRDIEGFVLSPWFQASIQAGGKETQSSTEVLKGLRVQFPDWFALYSEPSIKRVASNLAAIRRFIQKARNYADTFRDTRRLLEVLDGNIQSLLKPRFGSP